MLLLDAVDFDLIEILATQGSLIVEIFTSSEFDFVKMSKLGRAVIQSSLDA